jgi:hypothetical protein
VVLRLGLLMHPYFLDRWYLAKVTSRNLELVGI